MTSPSKLDSPTAPITTKSPHPPPSPSPPPPHPPSPLCTPNPVATLLSPALAPRATLPPTATFTPTPDTASSSQNTTTLPSPLIPLTTATLPPFTTVIVPGSEDTETSLPAATCSPRRQHPHAARVVQVSPEAVHMAMTSPSEAREMECGASGYGYGTTRWKRAVHPSAVVERGR